MIAPLIALLAVVGGVVAQTSSATPNTAGIPQCLLTCSQQSCPDLTDLQCICVTKLTEITACALQSCSQADLASASTIAAQQCAGVGGAASSGVASATGEVASAGICYLFHINLTF